MTQKELELENKQIAERCYEKKSELIEFYNTHSYKETLIKFGIKSYKQLKKILEKIDYDFSYKKEHSIIKGKPSARSHESYVEGGKKSGETQKRNWENKSEEEKLAWSTKQSLAHLNSPTFKDKITASNIAYRNSLTQEERDRQDAMRSESMKKWWDSLSEEEKQCQVNKHFENGAGYKVGNSKPNLEFKSLLEENNIQYSREFRLGNYSYDFKVGDNLIEINPTATHNSTWSPFSTPLNKDYHYKKSETATKAGYRCIHIWDWDNPLDIIRLLKPRQIIGARQCKIKEVSKTEAMEFINKYHLQGYARDKIRLGLYYKDNLVSIMTFNKPRYNKNYQYELIRYCSSFSVIGGAEKLFNYFIDTYKPSSIITYCDKSKFTGEIYTKLGFILKRKGKPTRHWYNIRTGEHYTDNLIRQQGFSRIINHTEAIDDNLKTNNNSDLLIESGFVEIFDSGQDTYIYILNR